MTTIEYSGRDNLDVMTDARNYNRYLTELILNWFSKKDGPLVDFGAGGGTFATQVAQAGFDVSCIETDPVLSDLLRQKGLRVAGALDAVPDASLAGIYSLNVLEHIEDDDGILALWHRKLASGGKLLVYVPAFKVLFSSMDRKVGHHRRYRMAGLRGQMERAGFDLNVVRYADSVGFLAALIYRLADGGQGDINPRMLRLYDRWIFPVSRLLDRVCWPWFGKNVYACAVKR
ncbi:bifunctional 2-polyprenyl-6-hydroxyphenol methylase/3-demethylubiquinol 3-O-methyltransferase UbiG [Hydrogenophaga sp.]|uniref:class I SAM-dependent methyltransferase n=1 Tax=Hydrogenophaga sp. TaxID=1904254 RepID=UPI00272885A8|nr:methyltransferase domain-containing protein [Hydrogenophaga sp.]MDO8903940.1 methyltransferase domain-containing protein [Hydrogenophaga sp.]